MSQPCTIATCKRSSRALCHCCQQNICLSHLKEHNDILNSEINPLMDEVNVLSERLQAVDIQKKVGYCRQKLEQWRMNCHQKIDHLFQHKCQELNQLAAVKTKRQQEEISQIRAKVYKLMNDEEMTRQDIDLIISNIRCLEGEMNNIEQTCFQITIQPLTIDEHSIIFKETNEQEVDLSARYPIHKTIPYSLGSWFPFCNNDHHLLFHQAPNLCLLNRELTVTKQVSWPYAAIWNMCWSSALNGFIVLTQNDIYIVDEKTMSINTILPNGKQNWLACTCSDCYLYASTNEWGPTIVQFSLSFTIDLVKHWQAPDSCTKNESIDAMVYNNETIALMIRNKLEKCFRIELRFSKTFDRIWSLRLDAVHNLNKEFGCCSLTCGEWLVIDNETRELLQITKSGILKTKITYGRTPYYVSLFSEKFLVIAADTGLNFHKLKLDI